MVGIPPRDETLNRLHDIVFDRVMTVLRGPEAKPFDLFVDYLDRLNRELDAPLRLSATTPTSSSLLIKGNQLVAGDGGRKTIPPIDDVLNLFPDTAIDFDGGAVSGGGTVTTQGGAFAFPAVSAAGLFLRMAAVYQSESNAVDVLFSDPVAASGSLANPGELFSSLDGLPIGYADLEYISVSSFKSIGSASTLIENEVDENPMISRFSAGGGIGGGAVNDFKIKSVTGDVALIGKGFQKLTNDCVLATGSGTTEASFPANISVNLTTILGSAPSADTTYYLYVDLEGVEDPFTLTDTSFKVIRINSEGDFALLTTAPKDTNSLRYVPVGHIHTADDASWDGTEASVYTMPILRQTLDNQFFSSVEKASNSVSTAVSSTTFAHGLSGKPTSVQFFYFDGTDETRADDKSHLLDFDETNVTYSSFGLAFGSGQELRVNALYVKDPGENIASAQSQPEFGWYTDTSVSSVAHNLSDALDIKGMTLLEHDVTANEYRLKAHSELVSKFDDTTIYFDWISLSPSATLRYRLIAGGRAVPASIPIQFGGCTKFVGVGPGSYTSITDALASSSSGDSILVNKSYTISAEETINKDDIKIKFMPGVEIKSTGGSVGWRVTGSRVDIEGFALEADFAGTLTDALRVEGDDCNIIGTRIRANDAGVTVSNAITIASGADRNLVHASVRADAGTITNSLTDSGVDTDASVRG